MITIRACLLLAALCGGCSDPCADQCNLQNECGGEPLDCDTLCADAKATASATSCTSEYDALVDCRLGIDDVCTATGQECVNELDAYTLCFVEYCNEFPSEPECAEPPQ